MRKHNRNISMTDVLPTGDEEPEGELSELDEVPEQEEAADIFKKDSPLSETIEQSSNHSNDDSPQKGWPLLPPFIKFIQGFVDLNIEEVLFPEESHVPYRGKILVTLLSYLSVYDFQKLRRLSTTFWCDKKHECHLPLFNAPYIVQTYLLSIGNLCHGHPHKYRAVFYFDQLIKHP